MGLPEGVTLEMVAAVLLPIAVVTVFLRAVPFGLRRVLRNSPFVSLLGLMMPVGVMSVLVIYTLTGYGLEGAVPGLIGVGATLGLHVWLRKSALSIMGGTLIYVLLVNLVF